MNILYERPDGELALITFDAVITESHEQTAEATVHPVESIADGVRSTPARLSIQAHVTNTPIRSPDVDGATGQVRSMSVTRRSQNQKKSAKVSRLGKVENAEYETGESDLNANVLQFDSTFDRVRSVESILRELMIAGTQVAAVTSLRSYEGMVITGLTIPRDVSNANAATITITLQEIRIAHTTSVDVPVPLETRAERAAAAGAQSPTEVPRESVAYQGARALLQAGGIDML